MGIHVCVERYLKPGERWSEYNNSHPDWDWVRVYGDRNIPEWFNQDLADVQYMPVDLKSADNDYALQRPSSPEGFAYLRGTIPESADTHQRQRWELLLSILESNPEYGVYFSY